LIIRQKPSRFEVYHEVFSRQFTPVERCPSTTCRTNKNNGKLSMQVIVYSPPHALPCRPLSRAAIYSEGRAGYLARRTHLTPPPFSVVFQTFGDVEQTPSCRLPQVDRDHGVLRRTAASIYETVPSSPTPRLNARETREGGGS